MQLTSVDTTPRIVFGDLEVDRVPIDDKERPCITQLCFHDPLREKGDRIFEAFIAPPEHLRIKPIERSYTHENRGLVSQQFDKVWPDNVKWMNKPLNGNQCNVVVMHNGYEHDWPILENEVSRIQKSVPRYWKLFDTLWLAATLGIPEDERSLPALCKRYHVKPLEFHDAYNDTIMLSKVFKRMIQGADFKQVCYAMAGTHPYKDVAALIRAGASAAIAVKTHQTALQVFFDFEATGINPETDRITEAAFFIPELNKFRSSLVNPEVSIPEEVQELTHITNEMVRGQPLASEVLPAAKRWVGKKAAGREVIWMGHNIYGYDLKLWKAEMERAGFSKPEFGHCLDTCNMSRSLFQKAHYPKDFPKDFNVPRKGFHGLQAHRERLGILEDDAHRALGDCRVNAKVFERFTEGLDPAELDKAMTSWSSGKNTATLVMDKGKFSVRDYLATLLPPSELQSQAVSIERSSAFAASSSSSSSGKRKEREEDRVFTFSTKPRKPNAILPSEEEQQKAPVRRLKRKRENVIWSDSEDELLDI